MKKPFYHLNEIKLFEWISDQREQKNCVTMPIIQQKMLELVKADIATEICIPNGPVSTTGPTSSKYIEVYPIPNSEIHPISKISKL